MLMQFMPVFIVFFVVQGCLKRSTDKKIMESVTSFWIFGTG